MLVTADKDTDDTVEGSPSTWPPDFPHVAIDELIQRLEEANTLSPEDASALIAMVAREAQRLRTVVVRMSMHKLSGADRAAREIIEDALVRADDLKAMALTALEHRIDEAEHLHLGMRNAFKAELHAARATQEPIQERAAKLRIAHDTDTDL